jgi:hypothetical protein
MPRCTAGLPPRPGKNDFMENRIDAMKELVKEVSRLKLQNLRLKIHMQVLTGLPRSKTAGKIRDIYSPGEKVARDLLTGSMN